jgi:hypothetical protein
VWVFQERLPRSLVQVVHCHALSQASVVHWTSLVVASAVNSERLASFFAPVRRMQTFQRIFSIESLSGSRIDGSQRAMGLETAFSCVIAFSVTYGDAAAIFRSEDAHRRRTRGVANRAPFGMRRGAWCRPCPIAAAVSALEAPAQSSARPRRRYPPLRVRNLLIAHRVEIRVLSECHLTASRIRFGTDNQN